MVSQETLQATSKCIEPSSSPARISFSTEFLDESNFISICPNPHLEKDREIEKEKPIGKAEFEFLSGNITNMITADELFREGKLLPFWQMHQAEKLKQINLNSTENVEENRQGTEQNNKEEGRISWFLDDDPSPRPPKCTVLWKELLRLKKQRASTLSPSSSSSSSSSSGRSMAEIASKDEKKEGAANREKAVKRIKKGLERTRSATIRIRPVINVPICSQGKNSALPPLFSLRKGRLER